MFWNAAVAMSIAFTAAGYWLQNRTVKQHKSGEAISITWLLGGIAAAIAKIIYGESGGGWAFTVSGIVNIAFKGWLLAYVMQFRPLRRWEGSVIMFLLVLIVMMIAAPNTYASEVRLFGLGLTWKDLSMWLIGICTFFAQKYEVKSAGTKGVFREALPFATGASAVLMFMYCLHAGTSGPLLGYAAYIATQVVFVRANRRAHRET